jgi:hypothetical protein
MPGFVDLCGVIRQMNNMLDWNIGDDEDDDLNLRVLVTKAKVGRTPPAGMMFSPINPEVLRLWIKSRSKVDESFFWHYLFGGIIVLGLLAMYIFI